MLTKKHAEIVAKIENLTRLSLAGAKSKGNKWILVNLDRRVETFEYDPIYTPVDAVVRKYGLGRVERNGVCGFAIQVA